MRHAAALPLASRPDGRGPDPGEEPAPRLSVVDGEAASALPASRRLRTVIADDSEAVRLLLSTILSLEPDFDVVGQAADGLEAVGLVERADPELLVLDLSMPGLDGLEVLQRVHTARPQLCVVVYSGLTRADIEQAARSLGARDFVTKGVPPSELVERLRGAVLQ